MWFKIYDAFDDSILEKVLYFLVGYDWKGCRRYCLVEEIIKFWFCVFSLYKGEIGEFVVLGYGGGLNVVMKGTGGNRTAEIAKIRMGRADTCLVCGAHSPGLAATLDYIRNWLLVSNHSGSGGWWPEASYRSLNCPRSSAAASLVSLSHCLLL